MKYIIIEKKIGNDGLVQVIPVIFPEALIHKEVADVITMIAGGETKVVSADSVAVHIESAGGLSETLGIGSREDDFMIMNSIDYMSIREQSDG